MKKNNQSSSVRPSLVLPPRAAAAGGLYGGAGGASPGPMTLVSNFFSDNDSDSDRFSFSQLLAGAISADDNSSDLRLNVSEQPDVFTVPPGMSPAGFLNPPALNQGPFGASIQQKLAYVSVEANSHFQFPNELQRDPPLYFNPTTHQQIPEDNMKNESSSLSYSNQRSSIVVDKPADDGYNWRKYGQKQVKGSEFPRSYYKCTQTKCPVKKKVERSVDGQITEIIYKGQHNHQPPQLSKRGKDLDNYEFSNAGQNGNLNRTREREINSENLSGSVDSEDEGEDENKDDEADEDEPDAKRRNSDVRVADPAASHRAVTEPRIIVQTTSEVDLLDDGYRWRKYGQKVVKGNPYPRSYYKCTSQACNVRKHVERAPSDPKAVITTYEGKHNHDVPAARNSSHNMANNNAIQLRQQNAISDKHHSLARNNDPQQITLLRFKEELT